VMLTCFKDNTAALNMYRKQHYIMDESSPSSDTDDPECRGYAFHLACPFMLNPLKMRFIFTCVWVCPGPNVQTV
jgi:hypothetical protein